MTPGGDVPGWFAAAIAATGTDHTIGVHGVQVSYRAWGEAGRPVVVLVHGGGAHAGWWDHVAPHLGDRHRVVAVDLSGHGDSAWRKEYSLDTWADEVMAAAGAESTAAPVLVGHSMGAYVVLRAAARFGSAIRAVVSIDAPVRERPAGEPGWAERIGGAVERRTLPDRTTILARFRTLPPDIASLSYVLEHIASRSVVEIEGGWSWKFDPRALVVRGLEPDDVSPVECAVVLIRGERGMQDPENARGVGERLDADVRVVTILDAGHHVMIDQPIALTATLVALTGHWSDASHRELEQA